MNKEHIQSRLLEYISSEFLMGSKEDLTPSTQLLALRIIDSISLFKLTAFIEKEFHIKVPAQRVTPENFSSVEAMIRLLGDLAGQPSSG